MRPSALILVLATAAVLAAGGEQAAAATHADTAVSDVGQLRSVYRGVLLAEYFGPASDVCSQLTPAAVKSFTAGGAKSCTAAFAQEQHILRHKTAGVDDSGYTPAQWRRVIGVVMEHLQVSGHGARASVIGGDSGIPGRTTLVLASGRWRFSSYPPTISS
jgi:hypothetical protein